MATITRTSDQERERLRRLAAAADQGPTAEQQAGAYPRSQQLDLLGDPEDPTNVTFPFLRRMRRDHMVAMGLHFIAMPIVKAPWYIEADDARAAALADNILRPIYGRLILTLLRMLWAGYSPAAKNFDFITSPGWTYLPGIHEDPKKVWDNGSIQAVTFKPVIPLRPENALPVWDDNGGFKGIRYDGRYGGIGYFTINGQRKPEVDRDHAVWAVHDQDNEDGSPYGFPRIAHCAPIFHMYRYIWTMLGRAFENNADPGPTVRFPREDIPTLDANGKQQNPRDVALRIGKLKRSGSTIALPSEVYETPDMRGLTGVKKWDIEYPKVETNFDALQNWLGFLESAKLRALWLQEQGIIEGSGGQSNRNVAAEFGSQRDESQVVLMRQLLDVIETSFLSPAMSMNMPMYEGKLSIKTIGFGQEDDDLVRQVIQLIGQAQSDSVFANLGVDIQRLVESRGFPMLSFADQKSLREAAATAAEQTPTPPVEPNPTQGRRALVTQTGFDSSTGQPVMAYVQLEDPITLSGDGDFVAALPRTDTFSDSQVVSASRALRSASVSFLTWAYNDFARYVGKQKTLDLAEMLETISREHFDETGEELADGDRVRRAVDRLITGWRPRAERLSGYNNKVRAALGRVFDRTASLHLGRLGSKTRASSHDALAAAWLDEQGALAVQRIMETTRQQLAEVLADGVRAGRSTKQIASDIREHFSDIPAARANTIARTETSEAYNYATVTAGITAGLKKGQLIDGTEHDSACKARNGRIVNLADALAEKLNHPNAIVAGTFVEPFGDVEVGLSAPWSGPVVELTTADGNRLAVTPNHPVLTQKGWVTAKFLREGDYVVSTPAVNRRSISRVSADFQDAPPVVEQLLDSLRPTSTHSRVVASPHDLHGDGRLVDGEVDVVRADRLLWREGDFALVKHGRELLLTEADSELATLARDCSGGAGLEAVALAAAGRVRSRSMGGVILRRPYLDSCLAEPLDDRVRMDTKGLAQLGRALAGRVAVDQLVKVRRLPRWLGHVYDLQTSSSMYGAGGIVVHNCTLVVRLLPGASANFEIRREPLDGFLFRYDADSETVLVSPKITLEQEAECLIALGDELARAELAPSDA